jgi:DNA-binding transcriptional ArsR family regulator
MGHLLERPQLLCDHIGASLFVVTHFNRGNRSGAGRITGAGPAEWGRVLIGAEVKSRHTDAETKATTVVAELDVIGGEIPDQTFRIKRTIWADDPDDLDSRLHYQVEVVEADEVDTHMDMPPARQKLLDAVTALGKASDQKELVDWIAAKHGHGLTRQTVSREMNALREAELVDAVEQAGRPTLWFLPERVSQVSPRQVGDTWLQGASEGVSPLSPHIGDSDTPTPQNDTPGVSPPLIRHGELDRADPWGDTFDPGTVGAEVNP